jgi:ribosomal-protein-serine acetyltransferase
LGEAWVEHVSIGPPRAAPRDRGFGLIKKRMNAPLAEAPAYIGPRDGIETIPFVLPNHPGDGFTDIRRFRAEDVPPLFEALSESIDDLCRWMVWCHPGYTMEDCAAFVSACDAKWERGESYSFVIFDVRDGSFLGSVGLNQINHAHRVANLGYWVRSSRAGRGIASAAVRLASRFGLQELGLNRLDIVMPVENLSSQRVAQKAGAKCEGILRNRLVLQDRTFDAVLYSMVAEDLKLHAQTQAAMA